MKSIVFLLSILLLTESLIVEEEWQKFKKQYKVKLVTNSSEEQKRLKIFENNLRKIEQHELLYKNGLVSYKMGITQFSDLSDDEFLSTLTVKRPLQASSANTYKPPTDANVPNEFDWRTRGALTPVKNQLSCGSCWAFTATGTLESHNFIKNQRLVSMSEQNLVDCASEYGTLGCGGGWMNQAFEYVENNGIDSEEDYPYEAVDGTCRYDSSRNVLTVTGFENIEPGNEDDLKAAVALVGPVSAALDAAGFSQYAGGIFTNATCNQEAFNHAVVIVGYGTENNVDYWIGRNSWGENWGENGYIRLARNAGNLCGLAGAASFPTL